MPETVGACFDLIDGRCFAARGRWATPIRSPTPTSSRLRAGWRSTAVGAFPRVLDADRDRMAERPAVQRALRREARVE